MSPKQRQKGVEPKMAKNNGTAVPVTNRSASTKNEKTAESGKTKPLPRTIDLKTATYAERKAYYAQAIRDQAVTLRNAEAAVVLEQKRYDELMDLSLALVCEVSPAASQQPDPAPLDTKPKPSSTAGLSSRAKRAIAFKSTASAASTAVGVTAASATARPSTAAVDVPDRDGDFM